MKFERIIAIAVQIIGGLIITKLINGEISKWDILFVVVAVILIEGCFHTYYSAKKTGPGP
ncbi:MAG: hypothetical protein MRERV_14c048 [Mycoplasmataceae bacterium RV_VA103A]|nr:MAG: hypothetical protein MRERV_14c048 [Mycoplasmataceae bacterium RV_VA103A]